MFAQAMKTIARNQAPAPSTLEAAYVRRLLDTYDEQKAAALWKLFFSRRRMAMSYDLSHGGSFGRRSGV